MHTALVLAHNCLELTKKCIGSLVEQDTPVRVHLIDNGSDDDTVEWYSELFEQLPEKFHGTCLSENRGVSWGWNHGLQEAFNCGEKFVTVINNDTVLPKWFISSLLRYEAPFVTGISVDNMDAIVNKPERSEPSLHPDFSAFCVSAEAYQTIGAFDEKMVHYAGDCDWHVRAHRKGIRLLAANLPFYHERSSTLRLASPAERRQIEGRANADRAAFKVKHGCIPGEPAYAELFSPDTFGCEVTPREDLPDHPA